MICGAARHTYDAAYGVRRMACRASFLRRATCHATPCQTAVRITPRDVANCCAWADRRASPDPPPAIHAELVHFATLGERRIIKGERVNGVYNGYVCASYIT